jgi:uncharacterized membrane protein
MAMRMLFAVHILAGSVALLSGYVALYVKKGAVVHRRSGMVFVGAMLTMCVGGALLAALRLSAWSVINMTAALTTPYLVLTSLATVRALTSWSRRMDVGLMGLAFSIGLTMLTLGVTALANGGSWNGVPAFPFFLFGFVGLIGGSGDLAVLRSGARRGTARLTRHLWRMIFALFIAAMSFFIGQMKVIPKPIRIPGLLALPVLAVLVTLVYWLWRVRRKRAVGMVLAGAPKPV